MNSPKPRLWTPSFALACAANFLLGMSFYVLMPTLPFHLMAQLQVDEAVAGGILASYVIAALLVRPFSGFIVERIDAKHAYLAALARPVLCASPDYLRRFLEHADALLWLDQAQQKLASPEGKPAARRSRTRR